MEQARRDHEEAILKDQEEARKRIGNYRDTAQFQKAQSVSISSYYSSYIFQVFLSNILKYQTVKEILG